MEQVELFTYQIYTNMKPAYLLCSIPWLASSFPYELGTLNTTLNNIKINEVPIIKEEEVDDNKVTMSLERSIILSLLAEHHIGMAISSTSGPSTIYP